MPLKFEKENLSKYSAFRRCLIVLLKATGWNGDQFHLNEYFAKHDGFSSILNGLSHMNYSIQTVRMRLDEIDTQLMPCLFVPETDDPLVLLERTSKSMSTYVGKLDTYINMPQYPYWGLALLIRPPSETQSTLHAPQIEWFTRVITRFKRHILYALFISFVLTLLSLAMPFFINLIFKKITTEQITVDLQILFWGLVLYLSSSFLLTTIRARVQSVISVRMDYLVINEVIRRILFLPPPYTATAPINTQLARVKDFDSIKEFFSGPAMTALLDMPFVFILLGGLAWIDITLAAIPFFSIVAFAVMALSIKRFVRTTNLDVAQSNKDMQDFLLDTLNNLKAIRNLGYTDRWIARFHELSARSIVKSRESSDVTNLIINLAQGITSVAGLMTMTFGVYRIFDDKLQPSLLMAAMLLTWRILTPMKTGFSVFSQVDRLRRSIDQVDKLMALEIEKHDFSTRKNTSYVEGRVIVSQVSLRYGRENNPVLLGVSFDAKPGETIVLLGHSGAGKSTLLKLILAMYPPQTGHILVDGKNTRHLDPIALRRSIAFMPSHIQFMTGSLREHLRMMNPRASSKKIRESLRLVGLEEEIDQLPHGLNTRLNPESDKNFSAFFLRRFNLALVHIKQSNLWLLDTPGGNLDPDQEKQIMEMISSTKGKATVIIATQNPDYVSIADRVLLLNNGRTIGFASPADLEKAKPPI
jgi:ATP-binding cassette subfamily C protein/ATP-binding cassette subfamily C protein LapB